MNKKLIILICLTLVSIGTLSGCIDDSKVEVKGEEITVYGQIVDFEATGRGTDGTALVYLQFDNDRVVPVCGMPSFYLNKPCILTLSDEQQRGWSLGSDYANYIVFHNFIDIEYFEE